MSESSLFPGALDDTNIYEVVARLSTTLTADITAATTTIPLASTTGFPTKGNIVIDNETVAYISVSVGSVDATGGRGKAGTAASHTNTTQVLCAVTATDFNKLRAGLIAVQTDLGITGAKNYVPNSGWIATGTFTYASASTITVASGAASIYQKGDKLRFKQNAGTYCYYYVVSVADTVLTVTGGSNYAVFGEPITVPTYSHIENPLGFPHWFAYTPTGPTNTNLTGRFKLSGNKVDCIITGALIGTPVWTNKPTLPITSGATQLSLASDYPCGIGGYVDAGTVAVLLSVVPSVPPNATAIAMFAAANMNAFSTTVPITWVNTDSWWFKFTYEI